MRGEVEDGLFGNKADVSMKNYFQMQTPILTINKTFEQLGYLQKAVFTDTVDRSFDELDDAKSIIHQKQIKNGRVGNRTPDLVHAKHALYQL